MPGDAEGFGHFGAVSADTSLQCCMEVWESACGVTDWGSGSHFEKERVEGVLQLRESHYSASLRTFTLGCRRGSFGELSNL